MGRTQRLLTHRPTCTTQYRWRGTETPIVDVCDCDPDRPVLPAFAPVTLEPDVIIELAYGGVKPPEGELR